MLIKVCGLKNKAQIETLDKMNEIDFLGFIFYERSKRHVNKIGGTISKSKKVGVFVNEKIDQIGKIALECELDILQLHGNETPEMCSKLKSQYTIIKAFGMDDSFDFKELYEYQTVVDYFLFDTKTSNYGGSGKLFDWSMLEQYTLNIPFLLSGGLNPHSLEAIRNIKHPAFAGIDINSGFENAPADKNIDLIQQFVTQLK